MLRRLFFVALKSRINLHFFSLLFRNPAETASNKTILCLLYKGKLCDKNRMIFFNIWIFRRGAADRIAIPVLAEAGLAYSAPSQRG